MLKDGLRKGGFLDIFLALDADMRRVVVLYSPVDSLGT